MAQNNTSPQQVMWELNEEVPRIVDHIVKKFSTFPNFDKDKILFITTRTNKKYKKPIKLHSCRYPYSVATDPYVYVIEVLANMWDGLDQKQKNLVVFHIMCMVPDGGFDLDGKFFAKKRPYDYELYKNEYEAAGDIPDWMENSAAKDPLRIEKGGKSNKNPVTKEAIESL